MNNSSKSIIENEKTSEAVVDDSPLINCATSLPPHSGGAIIMLDSRFRSYNCFFINLRGERAAAIAPNILTA